FARRADGEHDGVAGAELTGNADVGGNDGSDFRIPTARLAIRHQQNWLSRGRHLQDTEWRRIRDDVRPPHVGEPRSLKAESHSIGRVADRVRRRLQYVEGIGAEIVVLRSGEPAD